MSIFYYRRGRDLWVKDYLFMTIFNPLIEGCEIRKNQINYVVTQSVTRFLIVYLLSNILLRFCDTSFIIITLNSGSLQLINIPIGSVRP